MRLATRRATPLTISRTPNIRGRRPDLITSTPNGNSQVAPKDLRHEGALTADMEEHHRSDLPLELGEGWANIAVAKDGEHREVVHGHCKSDCDGDDDQRHHQGGVHMAHVIEEVGTKPWRET